MQLMELHQMDTLEYEPADIEPYLLPPADSGDRAHSEAGEDRPEGPSHHSKVLV
jgi:hypothetical protein